MGSIFRKTMKLFLLFIVVFIFLSKIISNYIYIPNVVYNPIAIVIVGNLLYFFSFEKLYENSLSERYLIILPILSVLIVKLITVDLSNFKILCLNIVFILLGGIVNFIIKRICYDKWVNELEK